MATSTISSQIETLTISVPKVDLKRLKGIVKAMGWKIEKTDYYNSPQFIADLEQAEQDIKEGRGTVLENSDDIDALFL